VASGASKRTSLTLASRVLRARAAGLRALLTEEIMSDTYQAVYDAVRSRIHGVDMNVAAEAALREAFGNADHVIRCAMQDVAVSFAEHARPSVLYRPRIGRDGNKWCALYGSNLAEGVCGFGDSPAEAMIDFDKNWTTKLAEAS
jgi:hypothetical protein